MYNFHIHFSHPWLLLLLIPAVVFTLIPYFRLNKRYRKTRNRICSMVLHGLVSIFTILALSGIGFRYQISNDENEIILLVDVSKTAEQSVDERDNFVQTVLSDSKFDGYKVGIVTFGFDQEYAAPLTSDIDSIYNTYLNAELPDTSATDIAAALSYTKDLFHYPQTGKIVLITDGKETDEQAITEIRSVSSMGIKVDVAYIPSSYEGADVQIVDVETPTQHVELGEKCVISANLYNKGEEAKNVTIELFDNGVSEATDKQMVEVGVGTQKVSFEHTFKGSLLHEVVVRISLQEDLIEENNSYCTYMYLKSYNNILILEREDGQSDNVKALLAEQGEGIYNYTILNINNEDEIPRNVNDLRDYDQIILNNISNADMPKAGVSGRETDFINLLYSYVNDYGGGLFTIGGNDDDDDVNLYNKSDLAGTLYQTMLPVQAVEYTPPIGVMIIVDRSGSMSSSAADGRNNLEWAADGARSALSALTYRDYVGFMTFDSTYELILPMTQRTHEDEISNAIDKIREAGAGGGTTIPGAYGRACSILSNLKGTVDKLHIILVTDGGLPAGDVEQFESYVSDYYRNDGITLSVMLIGQSETDPAYNTMAHAVALVNDYEDGVLKQQNGYVHTIAAAKDLAINMREDLRVPSIQQMNTDPFYPTIANITSSLVAGIDRGTGENRDKMTIRLGGFYGTRLKNDAQLILAGEYNVPLYAQWKFGKGMVGSFMCDLSGTWSSEFIGNDNGKLFIMNVIKNLMPTEDVKPNEIVATLKTENYINQLGIYTDLEKGGRLEGKIIAITENGEGDSVSMNTITDASELKNGYRDMDFYVTLSMNAANNYSRCTFVAKASGVYKIVITKYAADGTAKEVFETYKVFSYSEEYNTLSENADAEDKLKLLAERGNGSMIEEMDNPVEIFEDFITELNKSSDPRFALVILSSILFLLDIVVRKFKFKWIHEIVREHKEKKSSK